MTENERLEFKRKQAEFRRRQKEVCRPCIEKFGSFMATCSGCPDLDKVRDEVYNDTQSKR